MSLFHCMSSHHRHPTFMPHTKTCYHNLEFFCTAQCSAANMHIIHPSNDTFHLHTSASVEARLIYAAQSHYNQPVEEHVVHKFPNMSVTTLHSPCICCATSAVPTANLAIYSRQLISVSTNSFHCICVLYKNYC